MFRCAILHDLCTLNVSSHANSSDKNIIKSKTGEKSVRRDEERTMVWGCCQQIHLFSGGCLALASVVPMWSLSFFTKAGQMDSQWFLRLAQFN